MWYSDYYYNPNDKLSVNIDNSNENKYFVIIIIILLAMATDSILVFMNR